MKLLDNLIKQSSTYKHLDMLYISALDDLEQAQGDVEEIEKSYNDLKDILEQIETLANKLDNKNINVKIIKSLCKKGLK